MTPFPNEDEKEEESNNMLLKWMTGMNKLNAK